MLKPENHLFPLVIFCDETTYIKYVRLALEYPSHSDNHYDCIYYATHCYGKLGISGSVGEIEMEVLVYTGT